jgi:SulP family sulfate permease
VDQIPKILGIHFTRGTFVQNVISIGYTLPKTSLTTLAVGLTIIVFLLSMTRFLPKLPAPLLVVAIAIGGAYFLDLHHRGVDWWATYRQGCPHW